MEKAFETIIIDIDTGKKIIQGWKPPWPLRVEERIHTENKQWVIIKVDRNIVYVKNEEI